MYQIVVCPEHQKALVFFKDTDTHKLFKCPECDYVDYPGVVHPDLPEKYNKQSERIKELEAVIQKCIEAMKGSNCLEEQWLIEALKG